MPRRPSIAGSGRGCSRDKETLLLNNSSKDRIVLASSGGPRSCDAIPWLRQTFDADVVTVTLDVGQGTDLTSVRERALEAGAIRAHVIEARDEFVRHYVLPSLHAGALYEQRLPLSHALAQALLARRLVDLAAMEGAVAVAYASRTPPPGTASRLGFAVNALTPGLRIIVPPSLTSANAGDRVDVNLWGRTIDVDPDSLEQAYTLTRSVNDCPDGAAFVDIEFESGVPVRANGIEMPMLELIESLEIIAGAHGVGRVGSAADLPVVEEAPAATVLHTALRHLEASTLPLEFRRVKAELSRTYADLILHGSWHSPAREALDAYVRAFLPRLNGAVRVELSRGSCRVVEAPETHTVSVGS
jgi:argininosuccinate synthase